MPDKKLTDNEIIKALECCCSEEVQCRNCALPQNVKDSLECGTVIAKECLDLINRQKADYENLKEQEEKAHQYCKNVCEPKYKAEIERLQGAVQEWVDGKCLSQKHLLMIGKLQNEIETAKAEAVKEFAERLKAMVQESEDEAYVDGCYFFAEDVFKDIDNLVKEMVGDDK